MNVSAPISIQVICPFCGKKGQIIIDKSKVYKNEKGITTVNILPGLVCEHSFLAYIDKHFSVRDCFGIDFNIEIPQIQADMHDNLQAPEFDIDIIKYNLIPSLMVNVLIGVLSKAKVIILNDFDYLNEIFLKFFDYIFRSSFEFEIHLITSLDYNKNKKLYRNSLVLSGNRILSDNKNIIDTKSTKIENAIIQKFFSQIDSQNGFILFKNEITKLFTLSKEIIEINENLKENEDFTSKNAITYINNKYSTKITYPYFNFLSNIAEHYFNVVLKKASDSVDILGLM